MNERIMKLAKEVAAIEGWGPEVWQTTFTEKFAELIVRECVEISENYAGGSMPVLIACAIKEHFGVEE
jgi:hypothetical protein